MKKLTILFILLAFCTAYAGQADSRYKKAGSITVINFELFEHGMTDSLKKSKVTYTLDDIGKFNGHICPGSTAGFLMTKMALEKLFPNETPVMGDIKVVSSRPCGATDIAGMLTGAMHHFGMPAEKISIDPKLHDADRIVIIFTRISTGKTVKTVFYKNKLFKKVLGKKIKEFVSLKDKVDNGSKDPETIKAFGRYVQKLVCELVSGKHETIEVK